MWPCNKSPEHIINSNRQFDWILIKISEKIYCCLLWVSWYWKEIRWNFFVPREVKKGGSWLFLKGYRSLCLWVPIVSSLYCPHDLPLSFSASLFPHPSPDKTGLGPESGKRRQAEYISLVNPFPLFFASWKVFKWSVNILGMKSSGQPISSIYWASQQHIWLYHSTLQTLPLRLATSGCFTDFSNLACPKQNS